MDNRDLVQSNKIITRRETQKAKVSSNKWNSKCCYAGCPLKPSIISDSGQTCAWHYNAYQAHYITQAIQENLKYIIMHSKITHWGSDKWFEQMAYLENSAPLKMEKNESRSPYLVRLYNWINERIITRASELCESGR